MGVHANHLRVTEIRALLNKERYEALDVRDPIAIAQAAGRFIPWTQCSPISLPKRCWTCISRSYPSRKPPSCWATSRKRLGDYSDRARFLVEK